MFHIVLMAMGVLVCLMALEIGSGFGKWGAGFCVLILGLLMTGAGGVIGIQVARLNYAAIEFQEAKIKVEGKLEEDGNVSAIDEAQDLNRQLEEMLKNDFARYSKVMECSPIELDAYTDIGEVKAKGEEEEIKATKTVKYQCPDCKKQFFIEKKMQEELPSGFPVCPYCGGNQIEKEDMDD